MKRKTVSKLAALAGAFGITLMSTCSVFAGSGISLYNDVQNDSVGPNPYMEYDAETNEFIDNTPDEEYTVEVEENLGNASARTLKTFDWNVMPKYLKYTSGFRASKGGTISVGAMMTPSTSYIYYGIVEPDGVRRCVYGKSSLSHTFALDQTGYYNVYVRNENSHYVAVSGTYRY